MNVITKVQLPFILWAHSEAIYNRNLIHIHGIEKPKEEKSTPIAFLKI
jgi:hypothetical protein